MYREQLKRKKTHRMRWIMITIIVLIVVGIILFFHAAKAPLLHARSHVTTVAENSAGFHNINHFYSSNLNQTYYSVGGYDKQNQYAYAILPKNGKSMQVVTQKNGINQQEAERAAQKIGKATKIINAGLAIYQNKPAWVVSYWNQNKRLNYVTVDYKTGRIVQTINNL
ncbi:DUF5590 domain-containing protein [Fructilactobacillus fructivorans]|uniref:Cell wall elongation regulator TseB-like domain-containing protein n=2 Tax=Fructilactobacillus fructivorans TaxID=1614 RepID=A0AAE6P056_9LACO|nr:DUF5590 domain-containing protein [Fructilactobacillus fructivorans]QFX92631.1 hypothetical protein LF543_03250 [Fructilactobacillus fructivorans]RDV65775.1 hypothetical protein DXU76_01160 [Fructilactobacillus fructivorans]